MNMSPAAGPRADQPAKAMEWKKFLFLLSLILFPEIALARSWVLDQLHQAHRKHGHVQYQFGGCDDSKMDCSCFVQRVFQDTFSQRLPRTTLGQTRYFRESLLPLRRDIRRLGPATLCPGDIIYTYRGSAWETASRHVAIYFNRGLILHSASRVGVEIQPLDVIRHHRLHGVVRLFECRAGSEPKPGQSAPRRDSSREARQDDARTKALKQDLRQRVHRFFVTWQEKNRESFSSLWSERAVQWRQNGASSESVLSDWNRSFEDLGGRQWIYSVRGLQARDRMAFVEVETEQVCPSTRRRDCGKTTQTFIWQLGQDDQWRIVQHEIGAAD